MYAHVVCAHAGGAMGEQRSVRARETTIPEEKGKRKKERSNRFFGAVVCVRASEDERKRERKQDFPLLFKRFSKGALRAEFSLSLSLSLSFVRVCDSSSSAYTTHKHAPKRKQNAFFCFFREGGEVIEKKKSKKKKKNKNKNNKR